MTLDTFTTAQLEAMRADAGARAEKMFAAARQLTRTMSQMPPDAQAAYLHAGYTWKVVFAAGCEAEELARAIGGVLNARRNKARNA